MIIEFLTHLSYIPCRKMGHGLQNIILGKVTQCQNIISGKLFRIYARISNTSTIVIGYQNRGTAHCGVKLMFLVDL